MKAFVVLLHDHPRIVAWIGAVAGWWSFDLLRAAQIFAALAAALVSICALILTAPKAIAEVKKWFSRPNNP